MEELEVYRTTPIIAIDGAVVMPDFYPCEVDGEKGFRVDGVNYEYKYIAGFGGMVITAPWDVCPMASKDMKQWVLCVGVEVNGRSYSALDIILDHAQDVVTLKEEE